ncbi:MAG TPA: hypothetical protein PLO89_10400, partial [Spirochaetota bacterium]|nr:hypothetical protein [Spirochaetota bacterium]
MQSKLMFFLSLLFFFSFDLLYSFSFDRDFSKKTDFTFYSTYSKFTFYDATSDALLKDKPKIENPFRDLDFSWFKEKNRLDK